MASSTSPRPKPRRRTPRTLVPGLLAIGLVLSVAGTAAATPLICIWDIWECAPPPADTVTTTQVSHATITLGEQVSDTAFVAPADPNDQSTVAGDVEFFFCSPDSGGCSSGGYDMGSFTLVNGQVNTGDITPGTVGLNCFRAEYKGTSTWAPSVDNGTNECVDVKAPTHETTTVTTPSHASIALGDMVSDDALVTPADQADGPVTGSVEFFICSPDFVPCTSGGYDMGAFPLVDGHANTGDIRPSLNGDYCFRAEYLGNETAGWLPSQEDGTKECVEVIASTTTVTTPSHATITLGQSINDTAVVTSPDPGAQNPPVGIVKFAICAKDVVPCATGGDAVTGGALVNGQVTSGDVTPTEVGTYCFRAEYGGEVGWGPSFDNSTGECFNVTAQEREPSTTITTPSESEIDLGGSVTDHAHVAPLQEKGDVAGSVTFYVCDVNVVPCTSGGHLLGTVPLDGDFNATSPPFTPTEPGTYCFRGEFNGNREYEPSTDASEHECFTVKAQIPFFPSTGALLLGLIGSLGAVAGVFLKRRR